MNETLRQFWRPETPWLIGTAVAARGPSEPFPAARAGGVPQHAGAVRLRHGRPICQRFGGGDGLSARRRSAVRGVYGRDFGRGRAAVRICGFPAAAAAGAPAHAANRRGPRHRRRLCRARAHPPARARARLRRDPRHVGGGHGRACVRDAGHARQRARRPGAAARQLDPRGRLDQGG